MQPGGWQSWRMEASQTGKLITPGQWWVCEFVCQALAARKNYCAVVPDHAPEEDK